MRDHAGKLVFSPSDLTTFFESPFASWMDRYHHAHPGTVTADAAPEDLELVARLGVAHEARYLDSLRRAGLDVWQPSADATTFEAKHAATLDALRAGRHVIYQAALACGPFQGYADFLHRVEGASSLGGFHYEVSDTKLAKRPKPYFLIQLCAYAEMLESIQGRRPEHVRVINGESALLDFRTDDYFFYYGALRDRFLAAQEGFTPTERPIPEANADHGKWQSHADAILEELDHPCRVAGITAAQIKRLAAVGITTLTGIASAKRRSVGRIEEALWTRLRAQARLQLASRGAAVPAYEMLPPDPENPRSGLALLPPVSPMDIYFDMEGYPLVEGGLEYLFGATHLVKGEPAFHDFWAHDRAGEKRAFEAFIDWVTSRLRADTSMHIFHYGAYEKTALARLAGAHGTRERDLDALLRAEVFVDLYRVVKQSLRCGEPAYSLKNVERLYRPPRAGDVATAGQSVVEYARWMDRPDGATWETSAILGGIRAYNRDDCESTWQLRAWLADRQRDGAIGYMPPERGAAEEAVADPPVNASEALARRLLARIPQDRTSDPERWRIQELLAHLVEFHRREAGPTWRVMFERGDMTHDELAEDRDSLGRCVRTKTPKARVKRSFLYEYSFDPAQDTTLSSGSMCLIADGLAPAELVELDRDRGIVRIKLGPEADEPARIVSLIPSEFVSAKPIVESIARVAGAWEEAGTLPPPLDTFLRRLPPRVRGVKPGESLLGDAEADADSVTRALAALDQTTLAIQGPPGAGKTWIASAAITELALEGHRIGISSNSHKAIQRLVEEVLQRAAARKARLRITKISSDPDDELIASSAVRGEKSMKDVVWDGPSAPQIVGGTAWAFSHEAAAGRFDYLFVDEAGQVSVANLVGMSPSAENLVLLGDQMQLGQPIQGAHPGESGRSALEYLLQDHQTIPASLGIFLARTWRLHPDVCRFISGAVYEGRLQPAPTTAARTVQIGKRGAHHVTREAGIVFVPVAHEGNAQSSEEEVAVVGEILDELCGRTVVGGEAEKDRPRKLTVNDVLLVAPYNRQVRELQRLLEGTRGALKVGSVDKFQGQEAPVVIVSMCASSGDGGARGVEFLLNPNRLNVALSRAQSLVVVVASPEIARTRVTSVAQMKLVNLFCRVVAEGGARAVTDPTGPVPGTIARWASGAARRPSSRS
jgi:uncharacterized protein